MSTKRVYMDNNATTPLHPEVKKTLIECFDLYGNPSSMHSFGREAHERVENSRRLVADFLGASPEEIIFTGGGSESNNTVLKLVTCRETACKLCPASRREIVTTQIEHPSVLNTVKFLESEGIPAVYLSVDREGKIDLQELNDAVSENTALVSVIMANNEIGTIQDIKKVAEIAHASGALVHTDAVQALGKVPVNVRELNIDFLSFSGHKLYGPKGIGILYVKKGAPFCNLIHGGHQEFSRRAGTLNTQGIIGLGKAVELAAQELPEEIERLKRLKNRLKQGILERIPDVHINGHATDCLPGTLNVSFMGAEGEAILLYLDLEGIAVSTGSACSTGSLESSHVIVATGLGAEYAHGSIRFSLGRENTEEDVDYVLEKLPHIILKIRRMSSAYAGGIK